LESLIWQAYQHKHESNEVAIRALRAMQIYDGTLSEKGSLKMLGAIAAVLIILWLLGFFAFHVSSGLVHVLLVIGIVMLALHFFRGREVTA
jgi:hypothetical protein